MQISYAVSNRHVHLTEETANRLGLRPTPVRWLGIRGNYASDCRVSSGGQTFRLVLPFREYDQFEVLTSDCRALNIKPCYRQSGKLEGAPSLPLFTTFSDVPIMIPAIVAIPHLHCPEEDYRWGSAEVVIYGPKHIVLRDVAVWPTPGCYKPVLHVDKDEAAAFGMDQNAFVEAYVEEVRNSSHAKSAMAERHSSLIL